MSDPSLHAIEEMLPAHCLLVCSLARPFSGVLSTEKFLWTKPRVTTWLFMCTLQLAVAHCIFFLLALFLMQQLQHSIRLPRGPVQRKSSSTSSFLFYNCSFPFIRHGFLL